jgi:hypothetical protein
MIPLAGIIHLREPLRVFAPVEFPRVDDHAANGGAVSADPFRSRVDDDVGAVRDGAAEVSAGAEGVVDDYGDPGGVGDGDDLFEIRNVVFWVADGFELFQVMSDSQY